MLRQRIVFHWKDLVFLPLLLFLLFLIIRFPGVFAVNYVVLHVLSWHLRGRGIWEASEAKFFAFYLEKYKKC